MSGVTNKIIANDDDDMRLDRWFKREFPHIPHGRVEKLLRTGQIRIDGKRAKGNTRLSPGMDIRIPPLPDAATPDVRAEQLSASETQYIRNMVVYEDTTLIALNKPAGIAVQGGSKTHQHLDRLLPALGPECRLVHRLDRDTSGILLVAKSAKAARQLGQAFAHRKTEKLYWGVTNGMPKPMSGEIKGFVAKGITDNRFGNKNSGREIMQAVRPGEDGAKHARTLYQTVQNAGARAAWVAMMPLTGRTHQLRLHMQLLGAPLAGDPKYLTDRPLPGGIEPLLHLHARSIRLPRPNGNWIDIEAPLPPHMKATFDMLGFDVTTPLPEAWDQVS